MKNAQVRLIVVLLVMVGVTLACSIPTGPQRPPTPIPLTTEEVQQFEGDIQATLANSSPSGEVTVTITEQQLHSYLISRLSGEQDLPITDPQVALSDGQVEVYGTVNQSGIDANIVVVLKPRIDENGNPKMDVASINIGPFPVPASLRERIQGFADNALTDALAGSQDRFQVTNIVVTDDAVNVTGIPQQP